MTEELQTLIVSKLGANKELIEALFLPIEWALVIGFFWAIGFIYKHYYGSSMWEVLLEYQFFVFAWAMILIMAFIAIPVYLILLVQLIYSLVFT